MEQPTIFYAIVFALILMGFDGAINVYLAWGYVGLRVVHSLIQATVNIVAIRFPVFTLATLCLIGLTIHAAHVPHPLTGEAGGELDMGRPAELADGLHPSSA